MTGFVSSGATALATVPNASATNRTYSCESCTVVNGVDDWILDGETDNYTRPSAIVILWKSNGGGSYSDVGYGEGGYHAEACYSPLKMYEFVGHGEAEAGAASHQAGRETNFENCGF